ncbi:LacI family transcriptional regulator [Wenxinia marina]|uniref:Transcriptional regulator, LacI family n=1 Tax=Wenxinia marina DSM 24838 TaxID=1123501 RepID=A0A0D0QEW3_9RHOB|nr:LacI family transcriptional regulator [Wenxinia marina]KIQ70872.1 transcriptional regulator, LacI family [Wenxinia marina DSM 24838]GGL56617.1 LacI family transcriptional regulator [Wenxinia marina]
MRGDRPTPADGAPPAASGPRAKPTLRTISEIAGLAVPTVSRALNDAPDIGAETKARVRRIAAEIGYVPNRAGVRLRTGRTNVISLVLSTEHDQMNHTARLISSIAAELTGTPYHMIMTPFAPDEDRMRPIRYIVETGSADAMIFNQIEPEDPRVAFLMERGFPFATHGRSVWADRHPWADFDNEAFGRVGVEALVSRRRHNLVLIAPPATQTYAQAMIGGARARAAGVGATLRVADGVTSDSPNADVRGWTAAAVAADPSIDGLIIGSTNATLAAVAGMEAEGFDVGTDIDIVAKEAMAFLKFFRDRILVVDEDVRTTGAFLARAAIRAVREPKEPPMQHLEVPDHWR